MTYWVLGSPARIYITPWLRRELSVSIGGGRPMHSGRTVFAQLLAVVPFKHFKHLDNKHRSNH